MNATSPARSQRLHQLFSAWVLGLVLATGQAAPAADGDAVLAKILTAPLADAANCPDPLVIWTRR